LGVITGMPGARARIAHLELGGMMLELFQYLEPAAKSLARDRAQADKGYIHMGLRSDDGRGDYTRLRARGVEFLSEPVEFRSGVWVVYFRGPDGEVCELRQGD
jgi:catechol 2,3-dioxygenase-like lactoylglutathione lyase family enzyme